MQEREQAEEHLRVIRTLMERATIYQTISAPSALIGGLLAVGLDLALTLRQKELGSETILLWVSVCAIVFTVNSAFLYRESARRGEPFFSTGMKVAARAVAPSFLLAAAATLFFRQSVESLYLIWCLCYGLGLLAASHFAPASIRRLGRAFWLAGLAALAIWTTHPSPFVEVHLMGLTFGLFHLVYAACVWPLRAAAPVVIEFPEADA